MGSFLILEKGRNAKEKGIILVRNGSIKSYGFLDENNLSYQYIDDLEQALKPVQETAELRYIIKRYLAKKGRKKIIPVLS